MKRKFTFLLMALLALAGFKSWGQETLTVYDQGTGTSYQIPVNGYYFDTSGTISQFVIPSGKLSALQGKNITQLQFYTVHSESTTVLSAAEVVCSLAEVESEVVTGIVTSGLVDVFSGNMIYTSSTLTIPFSTSYNYGGGNLLISIEVTTAASSCANYGFTGEYVSYDAAYHYDYQDHLYQFLPKTTITYEAGVSCPAPTNLAASNITAEGATISWTGNGAESYDLAYGVASTFDLSNPSTYTPKYGLTTTSVQLTGLTAETEYKCAVKAHCSDEDESAWSAVYSFTPTAKMTLTVNEGNTYNEYVPFYGYYADNLTKSQFIIPATTLSAMEGADISAMEFYTTTSGTNQGPENYSFGGSWDVYFKIVDHVEMPSSYEPLEGMDKVYTGNMVIANSKMTLTFSEPYTYEGGNLMICFNQTTSTSWQHTYWKGVTTGPTAAYAGYGAYSHGIYYFLPTTTFTYTPAATYNVTVIPSEHGVIAADPETDVSAGTTVSLSATPNTGYVFLGEWHVTNTTTSEEITVIDNQFTMPDSDVTVTATFEALVPHMVIIGEIQNGTVALFPDDPEEYLAGETVYLLVEPDEGYFYPSKDEIHVTDVNLNDIEVIIDGTDYSFIMPDSEVTVTAVFNLYYGVQVDPEIVGGHISATSGYEYLVEGMPYFTAGSDVYFIPNPEEDYEYVDRSVSVYEYDFEEIGNPVEVDYNSGMARITMPESDIYVTASFNRIKYSVTQQITNPTEGGYFYIANTEHIAVGAPVTISSISPSEGYQFASVTVTRNDTGATVETHENWGNYTFYMPASDVTVTVNFEARPRYSVSVGDVVNGAITLEESYEYILAGTTVYLEANPATGYTLESLTVTPEEGDPFEPTQEYSYYYFIMPSSNVTISATFRQLQSYTINYYVNGQLDRSMECREDQLVNNDGPQNVAVPAGMTYEGWGVAEIGTYTTEKPAILGNAEKPTQNYDLYAVLSYSEQIPATSKDGDKWVEVTSPTDLSDGDQVIIVKKSSNYVMCDRSSSGSGEFDKAAISISSNEITSLPSNAVILTAIDNSGNWKFSFIDAHSGASTLADYFGSYLVPVNIWGGCDTWTIEQDGSSVYLRDTQFNANLSFSGGYFTCSQYTGSQAQLFKKYNPFITTTYYMTEVLTGGEVTTNTTAKNIIITEGTVTVNNDIVLTMAENGLFRNEDAANFVFEEGAQFYYDGAETVNATFEKNITGTEWYTISSPLAENTVFANVTNLIPSSGVTGTDYDLYRLNEAEGKWENARVNEGVAFTTIDKGLGYLYANATEIDHIAFAGEVNVAPAECTLTNGKTNGFNLIGNPFTQNIELANVTGVTLAEGFYVLSNDGDWGAKLTDSDIKPLQGFLVQATTAGTATIEKPAASSKGERSNEHNTNIEMIVSNSNHRDNAYAVFGEGIGLNKINHRNAQAPMLYVPQDGEDFAIAFMDENTTVFPLNFKAMTTGKYSISLKATDDINTLVLVDNMTGVETNMLLEESYSFNGSPADSDGRFTVKLSISHNNGQADSEHFVYQNGSELIIDGEGTLQIFDVLGRVVVSEEVHGQTVNVGSLTTGAYIVRLTGNEVKTQKIIIR